MRWPHRDGIQLALAEDVAKNPPRPATGRRDRKRVTATDNTDERDVPFESVPMTTLKTLASDLRAASQQLESAQLQLHQLATSDALTGCHNRRHYEEVVRTEAQRHVQSGSPLSLVFIDIDGVKLVNDTLGHTSGDRLIRHVAQLLQRHTRSDDYVFRWGGDEFVLLMTCTETEARRKGTKLKKAFAASVRQLTLPPGVGLSVGCAELGRTASDVDALIQQADERMYADKRRRDATRRDGTARRKRKPPLVAVA